ncbi:MAG: orotidine-5'-phosphate decarboxylase [Gammaproteobacteria bacterium]
MSRRPPFIDQIHHGWETRHSLLCVGLDPDIDRLPPRYLETTNGLADGVLAFCRDIVDATADLVCAFKPQVAYFAAHGLEDGLAELIGYIHASYPRVPVILDAKRGDIGDTARLYAIEAFERFDADAVTVNPYLGRESVEPYLAWEGRGVIVLCRTSNPDSAWLQEYPAEGEPVYLRVARAATEWNRNGNIMLVAGGTYPEELGEIRRVVGNLPLLVPGIGAQGADLEAVLRFGADSAGGVLVISTSRAVLYADANDVRDGARRVAATLRTEIERCRARPGRKRHRG